MAATYLPLPAAGQIRMCGGAARSLPVSKVATWPVGGVRRDQASSRRGWQAEQAPDGVLGEYGVEECLPGEVDHQPVDGAEIGTGHDANRRTGKDRPASAPGSYQPRAVGDELPPDLIDLPSHRMVLPAELHPEGHHHAGHVVAAEDCVAPGHRD